MNAVSPQSRVALATDLPYLPIFLGLRGRTALLIGGGQIACAKLDLLRRAGAAVRLVASALDPVLMQRLGDDPGVLHSAEVLSAEDFTEATLAIDASGDDDINRWSTALAQQAGVPINVVDRPELCDFIMPAILDRSPVVIAVSTGGLAPAVARLIRQRLETAIPPGIGDLVRLAARFRRVAAERLSTVRERAGFWERLFEQGVAQLVDKGRIEKPFVFAEALLEESRMEPAMDTVEELRVQSDDPDLLTVRAARLIRSADVIFHDPRIAPDILSLARRDARKFAVKATCTALGITPGDQAFLAGSEGQGRTYLYITRTPGHA